MSRRLSCHCEICWHQKPLLQLLESPEGIAGYKELLKGNPAFLEFASASELAKFTRDKHKNEVGRRLEDRIYRALLLELYRDRSPLPGTLLLFLFLFPLHDILKAVSTSYRVLDPQDIAQETFACFFETLRSRDLRQRTEFIGRAISERTKRNAYRSAARASRIVLEDPLPTTATLTERALEHDPELLFLHFLSKGIRQGWFTRRDAHLLTEYEIANSSAQELGKQIGLSAKGVRSRILRLLAGLRRRLKEARKTRGNFLPG